MLLSPAMVRELLRDVYDPELRVNVVDLGLVYDVTCSREGEVEVVLTLTYPGCPVGDEIARQVREVLSSFPGVRRVAVRFTFEPPWTPERMSPEARELLGLD
ncbi:MAG TPA: metal-sulfur cluster assembly factor [Dehalococcoidia bacterium]|nr:metal-sulfur cluster assembly factor [Dehalococcoidia bacterium]